MFNEYSINECSEKRQNQYLWKYSGGGILTWITFSYKFDNLDEMDLFLKRHNLPNFTQEEIGSLKKGRKKEEIGSLKRPVYIKWIDSIINSFLI